MKSAKTETKKSIELRNGQVIAGGHYTRRGVVYCQSGLSVDARLVVRKNGRKTIWA